MMRYFVNFKWFINDYYIVGGQEKIVRAFAEVMKNMARMKACVRPAMCKPYGKQSEALQKSNKICYI